MYQRMQIKIVQEQKVNKQVKVSHVRDVRCKVNVSQGK